MVRMLEVLLVAYVFGALLLPPLLEARRMSQREPVRVRARRQ